MKIKKLGFVMVALGFPLTASVVFAESYRDTKIESLCGSSSTAHQNLKMILSPGSGRHNGNPGKTSFILEERSSGKVLWQAQYEGIGVCYGFNPLQKIFIFGLLKENGIGVRLTELYYLNEAKAEVRKSSFSAAALEAFAGVTDVHHSFLAFIAIEKNDVGLYLLDVAHDRIRKLGTAPLPPPLSKEEQSYALRDPESFQGKWEWMSSLRDGYRPLDPGILYFEGNNTLVATYGNDTREKRATQRKIRRWNVAITLNNTAPQLAFANLPGAYTWDDHQKRYLYSEIAAVEALMGSATHETFRGLIDCLTDPTPSKSQIHGKPVSTGILCYQALTQTVYYEPPTKRPPWPGFIEPSATPQELQNAQSAWREVVEKKLYKRL